MSEEDLEKLRLYVSKKHNYDFKQSLKCKVTIEFIDKVKNKNVIKNKTVFATTERAVLSFDKTKKENYLLFLINYDGDKKYYGESLVDFI